MTTLEGEIKKLVSAHGSDKVLKALLDILPETDKKYQDYQGTIGITLLNLLSKENTRIPINLKGS